MSAHPFAPGAIEHHTHTRLLQRRALLRWLRSAFVLMAITTTAAFVAGLVQGAMQ